MGIHRDVRQRNYRVLWWKRLLFACLEGKGNLRLNRGLEALERGGVLGREAAFPLFS